MQKKYYQIVKEKDNEASIYIYGDIVSWPWFESDVSSYNLAKEIEELDVDTINVYINSYGGEVAEGLAIYNALKRHKAKVRTYCDGFACSAASVVFMAGDERIMSNASLLMIHNVWSYSVGDANQLRKDADDLDKITQATMNAYLEHVTISEEKLKKMMAEETWILPEEALEMGFATAIVNSDINKKVANQSAKKAIMQAIIRAKRKPSSFDVKSEPPPELAPKLAQVPFLNSEPKPQENKVFKFIAALLR